MWKPLTLLAIALAAVVAFGSVGTSQPTSAGIFPPGGIDELEVNGQVTIDLSLIKQGTETVPLTGHMTVNRSEPVGDTIPIEIVALSLSGSSSLLGPNTEVVIELNPNAPPALGQIGPGTGFPVDSFFDVEFLDIGIGPFVGPMGHFAQNPINMSGPLHGIPPFGDKYSSDPFLRNPILQNENPKFAVGFLDDLNINIKPPPQKLFSITVLKLNGTTNAPLPNWEFNLYGGPGCLGPLIDFGFTGGNGIIDFTGLKAGSYSVEEKLQPGWINKSDICQDVDLGQVVALGLPPCPTQPDLPFPDAGCDDFDSGAQVNVMLNATGEVFTVTLNGPTLINRGPVMPGPLDKIETEIVAMDLRGSSPTLGDIIVRESSTLASTGLITEQTNGTPGTLEFSADSFFDVFFDIELVGLGMTLHNENPLRLECKIDAIPPELCFYQPPIGDPIVLVNDSGVKVATIVHAMHIPLPPNEVLVVFRNNVENILGDVDCNGDVDVIDALLILQLNALLIGDLDCLKNADVDGIGGTDVIDALLILQLNALLIPEFPGPP